MQWLWSVKALLAQTWLPEAYEEVWTADTFFWTQEIESQTAQRTYLARNSYGFKDQHQYPTVLNGPVFSRGDPKGWLHEVIWTMENSAAA